MANTVEFNINLTGNAQSALGNISNAVMRVNGQLEQTSSVFGALGGKMIMFESMNNVIGKFGSTFSSIIIIGLLKFKNKEYICNGLVRNYAKIYSI